GLAAPSEGWTGGWRVAASPIETPATATTSNDAPSLTLDSTKARPTFRDRLATVAGTTLSIAAPARASAPAARTVAWASPVGTGAGGSHRLIAAPGGPRAAGATPWRSSRLRSRL